MIAVSKADYNAARYGDGLNVRESYWLWIIGAPLTVAATAAFLVLSQALQLDRGEWITVVLLWAGCYAGAKLALMGGLNGAINDVASASRESISRALSDLLIATTRRIVLGMLVAFAAFTLLATLLVLPTVNGLFAFSVAAFITSTFAAVFAYIASKRILVRESLNWSGVEYVGSEVPIGRKLGIIFAAIFFAAAGAIVLLATARVSSRLEQLAISAENETFTQLYNVAAATPNLDSSELAKLSSYANDRFSLFVIDPKRKAVTAERLRNRERISEDEIRKVIAVKNGSSAAFVAPHVMSFRTLPDGRIFVMEIPFEHFAEAPRQITIYALFVALGTALIVFAVTYFMSRDISSPLRKVRRMAAAMAEGDFSDESHVFGDDEISTLGRSFAASRKNLRTLMERISGTGHVVAEGVRVISQGADSLIARAHEQSDLTRNSSTSVSAVRNGAVSVLASAEAVTAGATDTTSRASELQASAEEVARSMDHLTESVEKISSSILQMSSSAVEMSRRTDVLAHIGEEVSTFVTEMDSTVTELQRNANATAEISNDVRSSAAEGTEAVQRSVSSSQTATEVTQRASQVIHELTGRISQITEILRVIEEIAGQTNLLSLNAAIIAAQAGEEGAGFTVVADEIRELATRTRKSVTEISTIVRAIQQGSSQAVTAIEEGVARVSENLRTAREASATLVRIESSAQNSYDMSKKMAAALDQQASAARHLRDATVTMSDHIHEINRATQEQAESASMLANETERVRDIAFQVKSSTEQQSTAARGITLAMSDVTADMITIRDLLQSQLDDASRIETAAEQILSIAASNDSIAREFSMTLQQLLERGEIFESEVAKFRLK